MNNKTPKQTAAIFNLLSIRNSLTYRQVCLTNKKKVNKFHKFVYIVLLIKLQVLLSSYYGTQHIKGTLYFYGEVMAFVQ